MRPEHGQQASAYVSALVNRGDLFALHERANLEQTTQQAQALDALGRWEVIIKGVLD